MLSIAKLKCLVLYMPFPARNKWNPHYHRARGKITGKKAKKLERKNNLL